MSILIFLIVLFLLVLVHELGHFAVAKWTGMRVDEFGIGFPPKLFGIKRGETEYTFNLFPVGGFVKIWGEDGVHDTEVRESTPRAFTEKSKWAQSAVLVAGVAMNTLFAWVLVASAFMIGVPSIVPEADATDSAQLVITQVAPDGPADVAGLPQGAVVTGVSTEDATLDTLTPSAFGSFMFDYQNVEHVLTYRVGEEEGRVAITPQTGVLDGEPNRPAVGVALAQVDTVQTPFFTALYDAAAYVAISLRDIATGLTTLILDAVRGQADFTHIAGPVGIVNLVGEASSHGLTTLLMFTAFISLNLAVINILPFPALDGGRLLFVIIEAIKGSPIKPTYTAVLNTAGFLILIFLMVAVTWNDIARIV